MARGDQLSRQWQIIQRLLNSRAGISVHELADTLTCHTRTVYRDLEALQAAGFPLINAMAEDGRSRWSILDTFRTPMPLPVDLSEIMALYFGRRLLAPLENTQYADALDSLFGKMAAMIPEKMAEALGRWSQALVVGEEPHKDYGPWRDTMDAINQAVVHHKTLAIEYFSMGRQKTSRREVHPYHLLYVRGSFYLVAHCCLRKAIRMFAVDRIRTFRILDTVFEPPADFDISQYLAPSFGTMVGQAESVHITFGPSAAGYISEKTWHPSQHLSPQPDGCLHFSAEVAITEEFIAWILQWGSHAQVIAPSHLKKRLGKETRQMASKYAENS